MRNRFYALLVLMVVLTCTVASNARAEIGPSAAHSTTPSWIPIVGSQSGVPAPGFEVTVVLRDFLNNVIAGAGIVLDFSAMSDVKLCSVTPGLLSCGSKFVHGYTDATGTVTFTIMGASNNATGLAPGHDNMVGVIYADGIPFANFASPVYDQNGAVGGNGTSGTDLSLALAGVLAYALGGPYLARNDFDQSGTLSGTDMAAMMAHVFTFDSVSGCATASGSAPYCP